MDAIFAALEALKNASEEPQAVPEATQAKPAPPPPKPRPVRVQAAPVAGVAPQPAAPARATGLLQGMFEDGNSLLRAVIAAEVLGRPAALREPALWNQQPNEPSI